MIYRQLGRTRLSVSAIALGTVALGTPYGFASPDGLLQPSRDDALELLRSAREAGITLFDTAPAYGTAESLVGEAVGADAACVIATKVSVPEATRGEALRRAIGLSLASSRRALRRDRLDVVQIHNATSAILRLPEVVDPLLAARNFGDVRFLGASVYTADEALAAIATGWVDVIQVPFNVLDQRVTARVLDEAVRVGVGVLTRSALLKGALTERAADMPAALDRLRMGADRVRSTFGATWHDLPQIALRFCLSDARVSSVLVGASRAGELAQALSAEAAGPLPGELLASTPALALNDERLIDPRQWPAP